VRTPSRAERDVQLDLQVDFVPSPFGPLPVVTRNVPRPDHNLESERLTAFELGYRHQFGTNLSVDIAAFHNRYDHLRSATLGALDATGFPIIQQVSPNNSVEADASGLEVAFEWHPAPWWRIQPSYTYLNVNASAASTDPVDRINALAFENSSPRHQLSLRSSMSLAARQQFDLWLRYADKLPSANPRIATIPAYTSLDLRYAWRPAEGVELAVVGQNLLDRRHPEFVPELLPSETLQAERGLYFKVKLQF
jgi:iron complex outermembrane receptor protein